MTSARTLTWKRVTSGAGHVLIMTLNRPDKRNAFYVAMLADLSRAHALLEDDDDLWVGVLQAADAAEGVQSFLERREARFEGR